MTEKLTRERFHELLDACLGAHLHAYWVANNNGSIAEKRAAEQAATDTRIALAKAVFP